MPKNIFFVVSSPRIEVFLFGICFAVFCLLKLDTDFSFALISPNNFIASQATADGVDISLRVNTFYRLIFLGAMLSFLGIAAMSNLTNALKINLSRYPDLPLFFAIYICLALLHSMGTNTRLTLDLIETIIALRLMTIFFSKTFFFRATLSFPLQLGYSFMLVFFTIFLFGNISLLSSKLPLVLISSFFLITLCKNLHSKLAYTNINQVLIPICFIPWIALLAVEFNFLYQKLTTIFLGYKVLFMFFGVIALVFYCFFTLKYKPKLVKTDRILSISLIMTYVLLVHYVPILDYNMEMFELANTSNSVLNVFKFGEIPFVDFLSSHMLSEQWYAYLYTLFFGFDDSLDFLAYQWLNDFVYLIVVVYFFNKIFRSLYLSLIVSFCFPFLKDLLFEPIFFGILPFLILEKVIKERNTFSFFIFFSALIGLIIWRIDAGAATLFSLILFVPIIFYCTNERFPTFAFLKSIGILLLLVLLSISLTLILRSPAQIIEHLQLALHYFSGNQAHGYSSIVIPSHQFYIYHVLFPTIAVLSSIWIVLKLSLQKASRIFQDEFALLFSLYLFILFLSNAQRGLVRHSFIEQTELFFSSTFFIALTLFIGSFYRTKASKLNAALVFSCSFVLFISLKYFAFLPNQTNLETGLRSSSFMTLGPQLSPNFKHRVNIEAGFKQNQLNELKSFLEAHLTDNQTFLDFSNTPMLYYFMQRRVPGYFNQNLQNTVDDFMQYSLINSIDLKEVPVVVFSNDPPNWFDMTDGIKNTVRYYLIAEFIYKNYLPYKSISQKSIWVSRDLIKNLTVSDYKFIPYEALDLKLLPFYNAKYVLENQTKAPIKKIEAYTLPQKDTLKLKVSQNLLLQDNVYIAFKFKGHSEKQFNFDIKSESGTYKLNIAFNRLNSELQTYMVRLSNHAIWHTNEPVFLQLVNSPDLDQIIFYKDLRNEDTK